MKTPEEMAEEWSNNRCPEQGPEFIVWCMCKEDFLAGYKAAKDEYKVAIDTYNDVAKQMMEEAVRIMTPRDQVADVSKVMPQWISVKDRLPEENEEVLVFGNILNAPKLLGVRYRVLGDQDWKYSWQGDGYIYKQDYVTHWMPLPAPPKEEK